jgi:hypothetical protein
VDEAKKAGEGQSTDATSHPTDRGHTGKVESARVEH